VRAPGTSYRSYLAPSLQKAEDDSVVVRAEVFSEKELLDVLSKMDFEEKKDQELLDAYQWVRDFRFFQTEQQPYFLRRISWQYPDDGCFTRAEMAINQLFDHGFQGLKKIFVFGDLEAFSGNAPTGVVTWWFHVAPLVKSEGKYYVLDPAISPSKILSLQAWLQSMKQDFGTAEIAVCDSHTYGPQSSCGHPKPLTAGTLNSHQESFLLKEWFRAEDLGRDPFVVLGEQPPWGAVSFRQEYNKR